MTVVTFSGCGNQNQAVETAQEEKQVPVEVETVEPRTVKDTFALPAYAEAWESVGVNMFTGGDIASVLVGEGDYVETGATLAALDRATILSSLEAARQSYNNAQNSYNRTQELYDSGFISLQRLEDAQAYLYSTRSAFQQAQSAFDQTVLTSPISGYVDRVHVTEGETLSPGQPVASVVNIERMKAVVGLPEKDVGAISVGDEAVVEVATFGEPLIYQGRVTSIGYSADALSRSYRCEVEILEPEGLRPGMVLKVRFTRKVYEDAVVAPLYALIVTDQDYSLFVLDAAGERARRITPSVGVVIGDKVVIEEGLNAGESLVVLGQQYLSDGTAVEIEP